MKVGPFMLFKLYLDPFELEESLRATNTMNEKEVYKLREIHFLCDFSWNFNVYSDLLRVVRKFRSLK